eukprot:PhF_6_TR30537/c0_g1_i3/m.44809
MSTPWVGRLSAPRRPPPTGDSVYPNRVIPTAPKLPPQSLQRLVQRLAHTSRILYSNTNTILTTTTSEGGEGHHLGGGSSTARGHPTGPYEIGRQQPQPPPPASRRTRDRTCHDLYLGASAWVRKRSIVPPPPTRPGQGTTSSSKQPTPCNATPASLSTSPTNNNNNNETTSQKSKQQNKEGGATKTKLPQIRPSNATTNYKKKSAVPHPPTTKPGTTKTSSSSPTGVREKIPDVVAEDTEEEKDYNDSFETPQSTPRYVGGGTSSSPSNQNGVVVCDDDVDTNRSVDSRQSTPRLVPATPTQQQDLPLSSPVPHESVPVTAASSPTHESAPVVVSTPTNQGAANVAVNHNENVISPVTQRTESVTSLASL